MQTEVVVASPRPEPIGPDTPIAADLFFRTAEIRRLLEEQIQATERRHGAGRRRDLLQRAALRAKQLSMSLAALSGLRIREL